tara:strand:- start:4435 stop:4830 length:396 start_codon:yes stop_codon:yes gene_type:complete
MIPKIQEWVDNLSLFQGFELYEYIVKDLGEKLRLDPLSQELCTAETKVTKCQYDMFVDYEDGKWKAYSNALTASGYAYILTDIYNSIDNKTASKLKLEDFDPLQMTTILSMNRATGFAQMVQIMSDRAKSL